MPCNSNGTEVTSLQVTKNMTTVEFTGHTNGEVTTFHRYQEHTAITIKEAAQDKQKF